MLASQEKVTYKDPLKQDTSAFEALESFAGMSGNCLLRNVVQDGATYAFIMRKGVINNIQILKQMIKITLSLVIKIEKCVLIIGNPN